MVHHKMVHIIKNTLLYGQKPALRASSGREAVGGDRGDHRDHHTDDAPGRQRAGRLPGRAGLQGPARVQAELEVPRVKKCDHIVSKSVLLTLYASKSVLLTPYNVKKCILDTI